MPLEVKSRGPPLGWRRRVSEGKAFLIRAPLGCGRFRNSSNVDTYVGLPFRLRS